MVLVNNPGAWNQIYYPLTHAQWDGCTPTDLIFPFFLFIVGVAMTFSIDPRLRAGGQLGSLFAGVRRRAVLLFVLGMILAGFPNMRLLMPFLLTIPALALICRIEPVFRLPSDVKEKNFKLTGFALLAIALLWFVIDFSHFAGPNRGTRWEHLFPLADIEGGGYVRIPGVLQRIGVAFFLAALVMFVTGTLGRIL